MRALALLSLAFLLPVLAARGIDTSAWHTVASAAEIRALPEDVTELRCIGLDDAALEALAKRTQLTRLDISHSDPPHPTYTAAGLKYLGGLTNLVWLDVSSSYSENKAVLTDEAAACLDGLKKLEFLDISGRDWVGPATFKRIAALPALHELVAYGCAAFDDACLEALSETASLAVLWFSADGGSRGPFGSSEWLDGVSTAGMAWLGRIQTLREIHVSGISGDGTGRAVTDSFLARMSRLPELEVLDVGGCENFTDSGIRWLTRCPKLKELDLSGSKIGDTGLEHLAGVKTLETLQLGGCEQCTGAGFAHLGKLPGLKVLHARRCAGADDTGLAGLAKSPSLRVLSLGGSQGMYVSWQGQSREWREGDQAACTTRGLKELAGIATLEELDLEDIDIVDDDVLAALAKLPRLRKLQLSPRGREHLPVTDEGLKSLAACASLRELDLYDAPKVGDAGIAALGALENLEALKFGRTGKVTAAGVKGLAGLKKLRHLSLGASQPGAEGMAVICGFTGLETLELWSVQGIPAEAFAGLSALKRLRELNLNFCEDLTDAALAHIGKLGTLVELQICGCDAITDGGIAEIIRMKLEMLNIGSCALLTDKSLHLLGNMTTLRRIILGRPPNMTLEAVQELKALLPRCDINGGPERR